MMIRSVVVSTLSYLRDDHGPGRLAPGRIVQLADSAGAPFTRYDPATPGLLPSLCNIDLTLVIPKPPQPDSPVIILHRPRFGLRCKQVSRV
jgi:hypothetical protein